MARVDPRFLTSKIKGASKVKEMLRRAQLGTDFVFSQKRLQRLLLDRTKRRFDERKSSPDSVEQKDPDGNYWPDIAKSYLERHPNPNRMLYRTGSLKRSIKKVRENMSARALASPTGGGFRIGVSGSKERVARIHNFGNDHTPQRRFLGIGAADVRAVDEFIKRNFLRAGIRVS